MQSNSNQQGRWLHILLILLAGLLVTPVNASGQARWPGKSTTTLNATIYLPAATLRSILQKSVNQRILKSVGSAITDKLPGSGRKWAELLIHPSTLVTKLTPQKDGLATTLRESLYPGDPRPIDASVLVKFSVLDLSTIQVSVQPTWGKLASLNGPLTQIKIPAGRLNSISPTLNCGDSALAINLDFPVSIGQGQNLSRISNAHSASQSPGTSQRPLTRAANAYVEIPSSALSSLGNDLSSLKISPSLTAQNMRIGVQNNEIIVKSDISLWQTGIAVASSTMHIQPLAKNGNPLFQVAKTDLSTLFFTFSADSHNQQIENTLNQKLANALANAFTITRAAIGTDTHIRCAASDSLILTGKTNIG